MYDYNDNSLPSDCIDSDIPSKPKRSTMKNSKMLMKIPKETNFSNKRTSKYMCMNDQEYESKNQYDFAASKYSTVTPIKGKHLEQFNEN